MVAPKILSWTTSWFTETLKEEGTVEMNSLGLNQISSGPVKLAETVRHSRRDLRSPVRVTCLQSSADVRVRDTRSRVKGQRASRDLRGGWQAEGKPVVSSDRLSEGGRGDRHQQSEKEENLESPPTQEPGAESISRTEGQL